MYVIRELEILTSVAVGMGRRHRRAEATNDHFAEEKKKKKQQLK